MAYGDLQLYWIVKENVFCYYGAMFWFFPRAVFRLFFSSKRQLGKFLILGGLAAVIDWLFYSLLRGFFYYSAAKTFSFLAATGFFYLTSNFFVFEKKRCSWAESVRFVLFYVVTLSLHVMVNKILLALLPQIEAFSAYWPLWSTDYFFWAYFFAAAMSASLNFLGQKMWIFAGTGEETVMGDVRYLASKVFPNWLKFYLAVQLLPRLADFNAIMLQGIAPLWRTDQKFMAVYQSVIDSIRLDYKRAYVLYQSVQNCSHLPGALAELGVFRGG